MRLKVLLVAAVLLIVAVSAPVPVHAAPKYRVVPCPFDVTQFGLELECGLLDVPENRTVPNSRTIALSIVRVISENAESDPMVYLAGGPGEGAAGFLPYLDSEAGRALLADRDWIIMDQRGTGYSVPRLECNIFGLTRLSDGQALADAVTSCAARYRLAGVDLTGYNTRENAADFADLRVAMGYQSWNLYGVSYGTTLALTMMRSQPEGIRSAVFDSVSPPDRDPAIADTDTFYKVDVLKRIFDQCAAVAACNSAYPRLAERFAEVVAKWDAQPQDINGFPVSGAFLVFALTNTSLLSREVVQSLPALIDSIADGDLELLGELIGGVVTATDEPLGYEVEAVAGNDGMGFFVYCNDNAGLVTDEQFSTFRGELPAYGRPLLDAAQRYWEACKAAGLNGLSSSMPAPVTRNIPVLMFAGEYDPSTPVQLAERAAESLPNHHIRIFPGEGHAVLFNATTDCPATLINAFVSDPSAPIDTECIIRDYQPVTFGG